LIYKPTLTHNQNYQKLATDLINSKFNLFNYLKKHSYIQLNIAIMNLFNFFSKTTDKTPAQGLSKTRHSFWDKLNKTLVGKSTVDDTVLDELEELLITADVGVETTIKIIQHLEKRIARDKYLNTDELSTILQEEILALLDLPQPEQNSETKPLVTLVVGVNGVGKTTTIGKLAYHYKQAGKQVILGAADTFRAAATSQLQEWGKRLDVPVIAQDMNADPAAVAHDATQAGIQAHADVVLIDTAGRLHNKINLMNELSKIRRTIEKLIPNAPQEVLLVLDASTGQNAFVQAKAFIEATKVTALAITKLDGTAKAGVVIGITDQFKVPIKYIGIGEQIADLQLFDKKDFVSALFKK
jgi:fused signal recognition particle receptor